ncbi:unnamed protein product [Prorocentrum cordatum]|uniref:PPPDE domain-containing protein n=1 Tax=Prorocentrum cordatum TaxID=2364126 RepID=A0ABN9WWY5_9DINO|nr:unnamed protein product [Polarella glacialis]
MAARRRRASAASKSAGPPPWAEVALSVYELHGTSSLSGLTRLAGLGGAYHVGVEVFWLEWSFGWSAEGPGVYPVHVGQSTLGTFVERVPLGRTPCSPQEVIEILKDFRKTWGGVSYHLLRRNCAHFSVEFARRLRVSDAPEWINSLASVGDALVQRLGADRAEEAADAASPPEELRVAPQVARFNEGRLKEYARQGDEQAIRELVWRQSQRPSLQSAERPVTEEEEEAEEEEEKEEVEEKEEEKKEEENQSQRHILEHAAEAEATSRFLDTTLELQWGESSDHAAEGVLLGELARESDLQRALASAVATTIGRNEDRGQRSGG